MREMFSLPKQSQEMLTRCYKMDGDFLDYFGRQKPTKSQIHICEYVMEGEKTHYTVFLS